MTRINYTEIGWFQMLKNVKLKIPNALNFLPLGAENIKF